MKTQKEQTKLTVLGAGIAGLAAALYTNRLGVSVSVYEKAYEPGGLCRTFHHGAHHYDSGAHRFHDQDSEITGDIRSLLGSEMMSVDAPSKIYDHKRFIDFPPTPINLLLSTEVRDLGSVCLDLVRARLKKHSENNFEDFSTAKFGKTLARKYLLDYSEKLWGLPANQLSTDVATKRLSGMTLSSLFHELLFPKKKTQHIDGEFLYPVRGCGSICETMAAELPKGSLHTDHAVTGLKVVDNKITQIQFANNKHIVPHGRVISTLPLPILAGFLDNVIPDTARDAMQQLRFRSLRLLFIRLATPRVTTNATLYFPNRTMCISRVHEPKNRSEFMAPANETSLVVEVPCFDGEPLQCQSDEDLSERVLDELCSTGLIRRSMIIDWKHHHLPHAYPVYSVGYKELVDKVLKGVLNVSNLDIIGRSGLFSYSHLHHQLRWGKDYALNKSWQ